MQIIEDMTRSINQLFIKVIAWDRGCLQCTECATLFSAVCSPSTVDVLPLRGSRGHLSWPALLLDVYVSRTNAFLEAESRVAKANRGTFHVHVPCCNWETAQFV